MSVQGPTVYWAAPESFTDNTPLDPRTELQGFEICIKQENVFGPVDNWVVIPSPLTTTYNLASHNPPLSAGVAYHVSLRSVTVWGTKSDPSPGYGFTYKP